MILDSIENAEFYYKLHPFIKTGLEFLAKSENLVGLPKGKVEIDGQNVFALVQEYETKEFNPEMWEAHRKYYDLQFVADGHENIAISHIDDVTPIMEYNELDDYCLFKGVGNRIKVSKNQFVFLSPRDVHQPGLKVNGISETIKKIVVKIWI